MLDLKGLGVALLLAVQVDDLLIDEDGVVVRNDLGLLVAQPGNMAVGVREWDCEQRLNLRAVISRMRRPVLISKPRIRTSWSSPKPPSIFGLASSSLC
jgi:hypothetical protein